MIQKKSTTFIAGGRAGNRPWRSRRSPTPERRPRGRQHTEDGNDAGNKVAQTPPKERKNPLWKGRSFRCRIREHRRRRRAGTGARQNRSQQQPWPAGGEGGSTRKARTRHLATAATALHTLFLSFSFFGEWCGDPEPTAALACGRGGRQHTESADKAPGNGGNGFAHTLFVFFLFWGVVRRPVALVAWARAFSCVLAKLVGSGDSATTGRTPDWLDFRRPGRPGTKTRHGVSWWTRQGFGSFGFRRKGPRSAAKWSAPLR